MVTVVSGFMSIFADAGIGSAVVQFREFHTKEHQSLLSLSFLLGLIMAALLALGSSFVALYFNNPDLQRIAVVMSLAFPFSTIGIVPRGMLERNMRFREIAVVNVSAALVAGIVGVIMAFTGWGYWALVVQMLINYLLSSCGVFILARLSPVPQWDYAVIQKVFSYSGNLTLFSMINYWARNIDNLLVGKFIGSAPLGYYNRAYQLMMLPLSMLSSVIRPVLHSSFAERQNDIPAMYKGYCKVIKMIGLVSIPTMSYAVVLAPELIRVVWGNQWDQSIPIFAILGLNGIFQPILSTTGTVYLARNKADWMFKIGFITTVLLVAGISFGLPYGLKGVAVGYTLASSSTFFPLMYIVFVKLLNGRFSDFIAAIRNPSVFSIVFAPFIYFLALSIRGKVHDVFTLFVTFTVSLFLYILFLFKYEREIVKAILQFLPLKRKC